MGGRGDSGGRGLGELFGPSKDDVISVKDYFKGSTLPVNYSLAQWKDEVDKTGIPGVVYDYMNNSSINDKMKSGNLSATDKDMVEKLKKFTITGKIPEGTILYSGLSNNQARDIWDKKVGDTVKPGSFLSTSPDPIYASGYSVNTNTMVKMVSSRAMRVGKTYWESSAGTEAILNPRHSFVIRKKYWRKVDGRRIRIIEVSIR